MVMRTGHVKQRRKWRARPMIVKGKRANGSKGEGVVEYHGKKSVN